MIRVALFCTCTLLLTSLHGENVPPSPATSLAASASSTETTPAPPAIPATYAEFLTRIVARDHLAEFVKGVDRLIEEGETQSGWPFFETSIGLRTEFRFVQAQGVVMYHVTISRNGAELQYKDAVKIIAFIGDRLGLTHPIDIREGEKPIFYGQWLIQEKEWKPMRKKMLEVRAENRREPDLLKAFATAIHREMDARMSAKARR